MNADLEHLLNRGPQPGEDFYRMKVTGNGETRWFNVSGEKMEAIAAILAEEDE
jgi:hypothetical protein